MNQYQTSADLNYIPTPDQGASSFVVLLNDIYPARVAEAIAKDASTGRPMIEWKFRIPAAVTGGKEEVITYNTNTPKRDDGNYFAYFQVVEALGLDPTAMSIGQVLAAVPNRPLGIALEQRTGKWIDRTTNEEKSALRSEVARCIPLAQVPQYQLDKIRAAQARQNGAAQQPAVPQAPSPVQAPPPQPAMAATAPAPAPVSASYDF